jgi:hypothetical protein
MIIEITPTPGMKPMSRFTSIAALILCAGVLPIAHAGCGPAPQPGFAVPDGTRASQDEMSAARDNLSEYSAQVAAYASCLDAEQAGSDARRLRDLDLTSSALAQLASVVSCFSSQVEAFERSGGGTDAGPARCSRPAARRTPVSLHPARRPSR